MGKLDDKMRVSDPKIGAIGKFGESRREYPLTCFGRKSPLGAEIWGKEPGYFKYYIPNDYLNSRGIRPEVLAEFQVGYYSNPKSPSALNNHILFPIHNQKGELVAFAWRTTSDEGQRYGFPASEMKLQSGQVARFNKGLELWNVHRAVKEGHDVYVVEGFFAAMNLWQSGYRCVIALMGSNLSDEQAKKLTEEFKTATFLIDPDEAGQKLRKHVYEKLVFGMPVRLIRCE